MKEAVTELRDPFESQASYGRIKAAELYQINVMRETIFDCDGRRTELIWSSGKDHLVFVRKSYIAKRSVTEDQLRFI